MSELKPCPFCGSKARLLGGPEAQGFYAVCCHDGHHVTYGLDRDKAIREWNTRADGWVSIEDAVPDHMQTVLVLCGGFVGMAPYNKVHKFKSSYFGSQDVGHYDVTHWKHLPSPDLQ